MRLLFICSRNQLRSPTAEAVFAEYPGVETCSAGTNADCENPVSGDLIEWADAILVMEQTHREKVARKFQNLLKNKKFCVLGIADNYEFMDLRLITIIKRRVPQVVDI